MRNLNLQRTLDKKLKEDDFVLLYQMGNIGFPYLETSLEKISIPHWQIHTFDDNQEFLIYRNTDDVNCFFDWHIRASYKILLNYRCRILQKRDYLRIITLVQDPIATAIAQFFEDLPIQFIECTKNFAIYGDINETVNFLMEAFEQQVRFDYFTDWFEKEFKKNFDVDVLSYVKSNTRDWWRIEQSGRDILLIKNEALAKQSSLFADFLESPNFSFVKGKKINRWYSQLYQEFIKNYPFENLFFLYDSFLYQKIYSKKEINAFKKKWSSK